MSETPTETVHVSPVVGSTFDGVNLHSAVQGIFTNAPIFKGLVPVGGIKEGVVVHSEQGCAELTGETELTTFSFAEQELVICKVCQHYLTTGNSFFKATFELFYVLDTFTPEKILEWFKETVLAKKIMHAFRLYGHLLAYQSDMYPILPYQKTILGSFYKEIAPLFIKKMDQLFTDRLKESTVELQLTFDDKTRVIDVSRFLHLIRFSPKPGAVDEFFEDWTQLLLASTSKTFNLWTVPGFVKLRTELLDNPVPEDTYLWDAACTYKKDGMSWNDAFNTAVVLN